MKLGSNGVVNFISFSQPITSHALNVHLSPYGLSFSAGIIKPTFQLPIHITENTYLLSVSVSVSVSIPFSVPVPVSVSMTLAPMVVTTMVSTASMTISGMGTGPVCITLWRQYITQLQSMMMLTENQWNYNYPLIRGLPKKICLMFSLFPSSLSPSLTLNVCLSCASSFDCFSRDHHTMSF